MHPVTPADSATIIPVVTKEQLKRERLRFVDFRFRRTPSALGTAEVELEWLEQTRVVGRASGQSSAHSDLRIAAEATLRAIEQFAEGALRFELVGIKAMRVFDTNIAIASIAAREGSGPPTRLMGCFLADDDPTRASVFAVLNATNRLLGNYIATR